ncbi:MAG TPA: BPTI/Kunitz domain-containing protein [Cyclobacteriaceae bacterium]|nr:BPTI/Kunitz domain-containing protein [Cyclobacteriaceae bacterium]
MLQLVERNWGLENMDRYIKIIVVLLIQSLTQCKDDCLQSDRCNLEPDTGPCYAIFTKYYYDKEARKCKPFSYGGCYGVVPFDTLEECKNRCHCN